MIIYIILSFFVGVIFGIFLSALCKASNDDFEKIEMLKKLWIGYKNYEVSENQLDNFIKSL